MRAKPLSAPAYESGEQPRHYRFWWLFIIVFSLAGWALIISVVSLLFALAR